jgi:hypothetical protein
MLSPLARRCLLRQLPEVVSNSRITFKCNLEEIRSVIEKVKAEKAATWSILGGCQRQQGFFVFVCIEK